MDAPHKLMHLTWPVEDRNGNDIICPVDPSPVSLRTNSSLSHGSTDSPDDVEMSEDCIGEVNSDKNIMRKVVLQSDNTDMVDYIKTNNNSYNKNETLMVSGLPNRSAVSEHTQLSTVRGPVVRGNGRASKTCLVSREQEVLDSVKLSCSSSDERCMSLSSSDMVFRSNSFILHESEPLLSNSLLEESSDIPSDVGLKPDLLPDVCEGLVNNSASGKDPKRQEFGVTFIQPANQTFIMEEEVFQPTSGSLLPRRGTGDSRSSHLIPGVDPSECVTPGNWNKSNTEAPRFQHHASGSYNSTPAEGKTILIAASEELDISGNVQTSTPVQSLSSKTFCLPSLSDSSFSKGKGDFGSPMAQVIKDQQCSVSQKPKTPLTAPTKINKSEIKKFKPDFSDVKSKIASRPNSSLKPSGVAGISSHVNKNQVNKPSHSTQLKGSLSKSASAVSSSTVIKSTCNSLKKVQSTVSKRVHSSTSQVGVTGPKSRFRTLSETSDSSKTTKETSDKEAQDRNNVNVFSSGKPSSVDKQASGEEKQEDGSLSISRRSQKISLKTPSPRLAEPAPCNWGKGKPGPQPSSRAGGASAARVPAANLRQPPLSASKFKPGTVGKNGCVTAEMPSSKIKPSTSGVNPKMHLSEGTGAELSGPTHTSHTLTAAQLHNTASKLPVKQRGQLKNTSGSSGHTKPDYVEPSSGVYGKPPTNRNTSFRPRLQSLPPKASSSGCKGTPISSQASVRTSPSVLKTPSSPRHVRLTGALSVDRGKVKTTSRSQHQGQTSSHPDLVPPETKPRGVEYFKALCEKKNQTIQLMKTSFKANNRRFEAIAVVIQNLCAENEESVKRRQELSSELLKLREELVTSVQSCERLEQEKEEVRLAFDGVLQKVQEQHRSDLADLEERLKTFYSAEWEKVHQTYQEEAEKYKAQMKQQLEELVAKHEGLKKELEASHKAKMESLKNYYEKSFEELRKSHAQDMTSLEKTLKDSEAMLSNQIEELASENNLLSEKLKAEEDKRKELADKCQDSHTLYLEQELESLKVVLDIKNKQIHQQDKKLMQMDKVLEKNVKLDECFKKVQQENEDLKARMDKHAALSRQLSTEQAVLQESLQKETKVNKRLSMENEELIWKLQNGDLSSPRKTSPSSPSITLQSPRNSGLFSTSPPISPR
ncbi:microtubule-associated tumor suppressor 1 homolog A isoform X2 [Hoplias malabaricus]|uniref:microtubule-associated tumor suppressor 1 homolog A isoform X2 n=1 Tax=Hoplias malabaricus TaxID=27720 RepID=UPI0034623BAF